MANASRSSTPKSTTGSYDHYWPLTGHLHHPSYATHCPPSTGTSTLTTTTPASESLPENSRHIHEFVTPSFGYACGGRAARLSECPVVPGPHPGSHPEFSCNPVRTGMSPCCSWPVWASSSCLLYTS